MNKSELNAYWSFAKDVMDLGLDPPLFTQFMQRPDYYEKWLWKAKTLHEIANADDILDTPPDWFAVGMGWSEGGG